MRIAIIATLDTKLKEALYIKNRIESKKSSALLIDTSILPHDKVGDIDIKDLLNKSDFNIDEKLKVEKRSKIIEQVGLECGKQLKLLYDKGDINGVLGIGGNQGTAICGIAFQNLPFIFPKMIISTVASGDIRPYVRDKDIFVVFSITDFLFGPNFINKYVIDNAIDSIMEMAKIRKVISKPSKTVVAMTAFGNTSKACNICADLLRDMDFEPIVFHASGAGGSAMEELIEEGYIDGVIDLTTHEIIGELFTFDIYKPAIRNRFMAASKRGIPQVIVPGGMDYFVFGPPDTIPDYLKNRKIHYHNPYNTNVRISGDELVRVADLMIERLDASSGPVAILIPMKGWTEIGSDNNELFDPEANNKFIDYLEKNFAPGKGRVFEKINDNINAFPFCQRCVQVLVDFINIQLKGKRD